MTQSEGLAALNEYATQAGVSSRNAVETWANATFWGQNDSENKNILWDSSSLPFPTSSKSWADKLDFLSDYLYNGTFSGSNLPSPTQIELFYKQQMISRIINSQWRYDGAQFYVFKNSSWKLLTVVWLVLRRSFSLSFALIIPMTLQVHQSPNIIQQQMAGSIISTGMLSSCSKTLLWAILILNVGIQRMVFWKVT